MKEFIDLTIFSFICLATPIVVALSTYVIVEACNKLQPKVNRLIDSNYR